MRLSLFRVSSVFLFLLLGACAAPSGEAHGRAEPLSVREAAESRDVGRFTSMVADRLNAANAGSPAAVAGPLSLKTQEMSLSLDRIWSFCLREPAGCDRAVAEYVSGAAATATRAATGIEKSQLRVAVRPTAYLQSTSQAGQPLTRPLAADLSLVLMADSPRAAKVVTVQDLGSLALDGDQAFELALANTFASLRPMSAVAPALPSDGIGAMEGDYYESSRLARPADWAHLASGMVGSLIVAAPDPSVLLYADAGRPNAEAAMRELVLRIASKSSRPLSDKILRWTPAGWVDATR